MPNLYGVANPVNLPQSVYFNPFSDVACPAGVETNVIPSNPFVALSNGYYFVTAVGTIYLAIGATAPSQVSINIRTNNGADDLGQGAAGFLLVANTTYAFPFYLFTTARQTVFQGAGATIQISVTSTGQPVTARASGSQCLMTMFRAPDQ
jgi:hypothetical protein